MIRRISAWLLLIFFVILLMNIMIFKLYIAESVMLYGLMIALFFFMRVMNRGGAYNGPEENEGDAIDEDEEESDGELGESSDGSSEQLEGGRIGTDNEDS